VAEPYRNAGLPLYSPATHLHGLCSIPSTPVNSIANINFRRKHLRFITPSVPFAERRIIEMMFRSYPDVMTVKQLAAALGIGINKAYEIVNDGTINSKRIGRRILIPKLYLVDYIQQTRYNKGV
jgi:excisionase family DNA binding protein